MKKNQYIAMNKAMMNKIIELMAKYIGVRRFGVSE